MHFYESERRNFLGPRFREGGLSFQGLRESGSRFQARYRPAPGDRFGSEGGVLFS